MITRIAICDDEQGQLDLLEDAVNNCEAFSDKPLSVERFSDGASLLDSVELGHSYYFIFLDIHMPEPDGLGLYDKLAREGTSIIFVSTHIDKLPDTHALHAPGFLPKPYTQELFDRTVKSAIAQRTELFYLTFYDYYRNAKSISCRDIFYLSVSGHLTHAYTADGDFSAHGMSLNELERQLNPYGFFKCDRCFLVNLMHCEHRKGGIVMFKDYTPTEEVIISRRKLTVFDKMLLRNRWR